PTVALPPACTGLPSVPLYCKVIRPLAASRASKLTRTSGEDPTNPTLLHSTTNCCSGPEPTTPVRTLASASTYRSSQSAYTAVFGSSGVGRVVLRKNGVVVVKLRTPLVVTFTVRYGCWYRLTGNGNGTGIDTSSLCSGSTVSTSTHDEGTVSQMWPYAS